MLKINIYFDNTSTKSTFIALNIPSMKLLKIHLIAIGGAAMHNIALDLVAHGHHVSGSDDEIYEPSLSRLKKVGIAPEKFGWFPEKIHTGLDIVILGKHAKADNPELLKAQALGITILSYPAFIYEHSKDKKRVVIAGSHGKTTTTAMILHVLKKNARQFDYLVGAQLEGFDRMVQLTDAPLIVIEGDEYLSSAVDRVPKIMFYKPHIVVITGIAWDHVNVFPTYENYKQQFVNFIQTIDKDGILIYAQDDAELSTIVTPTKNIKTIAYPSLMVDMDKNVIFRHKHFPISIIGRHNLQNMNAARLVCNALDIDDDTFFASIADFTGASKRLQKLSSKKKRQVYLDFAHAPSKVKATTEAFKAWFDDKKLLAVLELHTFSSLNEKFLPQYQETLDAADDAVVFYNAHTLKIKNMPDLSESLVQQCFSHPKLRVFTDEQLLWAYLNEPQFDDHNLLLMSSGNFNKMQLDF